MASPRMGTSPVPLPTGVVENEDEVVVVEEGEEGGEVVLVV